VIERLLLRPPRYRKAENKEANYKMASFRHGIKNTPKTPLHPAIAKTGMPSNKYA
jgi:hypothetical protein